MKQISEFYTAFAFLVAIPCMLSAAEAQPMAQEARQILDATNVKGGLIVHVGCGDGKLTAALHANDRYLVHGLDKDAENVQQAQKHIRSLGLYGKVSVGQWKGKHLPYIDNLVNLLVAEGRNMEEDS
jgi:ubiquinone/menaquinone biosynthesis C-methylase UbiE